MSKSRLDLLLVEKRLVDSRSLAQRMVMAGQVRVNGEVVLKSSFSVDPAADISIDPGPRYVSRGGEKLAAALDSFEILIEGKTCADVGASTGGFTDCLLQNGAKCVYSIDVGKGILHWKMRKRSDVIVMEQTNARYVSTLPEPVQFVSIDVSFISLKTLLPVIKNWFPGTGDIVALIKPQFEAGRKIVSKGDGVVRDPEIHRLVLKQILKFAKDLGFGVRGLIRSPLLGPKGNAEFLVWLSCKEISEDIDDMINSVMIE